MANMTQVLFGVGRDEAGVRWCVLVRIQGAQFQGPTTYDSEEAAQAAAVDVSTLSKLIVSEICPSGFFIDIPEN
jgi:hypothetical protein